MEKTKTKIRCALAALLCICFLTSCRKREPVELYKGGVVYLKKMSGAGEMYYHIKKNGKFHFIVLYKLDWDKYTVGDTIK